MSFYRGDCWVEHGNGAFWGFLCFGVRGGPGVSIRSSLHMKQTANIRLFYSKEDYMLQFKWCNKQFEIETHYFIIMKSFKSFLWKCACVCFNVCVCYRVCRYLILVSMSRCPAEYCSITSFTSYGLRVSLKRFLLKRNIMILQNEKKERSSLMSFVSCFG